MAASACLQDPPAPWLRFLEAYGRSLGVEGNAVHELARSLAFQGLQSPPDLAALAPGGALPDRHRQLLLRGVGPEGGILLDEAVAHAFRAG